MRTNVSTILLAAALAGCGPPPSPATFGADYEDALCAWATACSVFTSRGQCRESLVWDSNGRFEYLEQSVAEGRSEFDADAAELCILQVQDQACDERLINDVLFTEGLTAAPESCRQVYTGKVRNYDPCLSSEECAGERVVCGFLPNCPDACCAGSCRQLAAPPEIGEACTGTCAEGAFCAVDPNTFQPTVCTKLRGAGKSCADVSNSCAEGLYCDFAFSDGVCTKLATAGQSCDNGARCAEDLQCYHWQDTDERRCQALPGQGEACSTSNYPACARIDNDCDPISGTCQPLAAPGESCDSERCMPYADCQYSDSGSTCTALAALGEECGSVELPDGGYNYISCLGHLNCGEDGLCVEPEPEAICELPE